MDITTTLAEELGIKPSAVEATVALIDEGNTIPFIARYRKEVTGGLDDVVLRTLSDRLTYLRNLEHRKEEVILLIDVQGKLTPELEQQIREATQLQRVEDLYKPYRKKRQTRAQKAREAGLEPLANMIIMQASVKGTALDAAAEYMTPEAAEAGYDTPEKILAGAQDIVAETVAEDAENVADIRAFTEATADITSVARKCRREDAVRALLRFMPSQLQKFLTIAFLQLIAASEKKSSAFNIRVDAEAAIARLGSRWPATPRRVCSNI